MQDTNKIYGKHSSCYLMFIEHCASWKGFTITMYEFEKTIATLWATVKGRFPLLSEFWPVWGYFVSVLSYLIYILALGHLC